jgi:hypothetical protein
MAILASIPELRHTLVPCCRRERKTDRQSVLKSGNVIEAYEHAGDFKEW